MASENIVTYVNAILGTRSLIDDYGYSRTNHGERLALFIF